MNIGQLLFSLEGRINRAKFWAGDVIGMVLAMILYVLVSRLLGGMTLPVPAAAPQGLPQFRLNPDVILAGIVIDLLSSYILLAVSAKRCHDRNKSAWWLVVFLPGYLLSLYQNFLIYRSGGDFAAVASDPAKMWVPLVSAVLGLVVFIWWLIDLGIMEGTKGPNAYGPDPLGRAAIGA